MNYIYLSKKIRISVLIPGALFLMLVRSREAFFACLFSVAVHEAGHLFAGLLLGRRPASFSLGLSGADIGYKGVLSYGDDLFISLAGPFFSAAAGLLLLPFSEMAALYGLLYGGLNLLPVGVFDGGRALRAVLFSLLPYGAAERIYSFVSFVFLFLLYLTGVFVLLCTSCNATLFFISAYAFLAAVTEKRT